MLFLAVKGKCSITVDRKNIDSIRTVYIFFPFFSQMLMLFTKKKLSHCFVLISLRFVQNLRFTDTNHVRTEASLIPLTKYIC